MKEQGRMEVQEEKRKKEGMITREGIADISLDCQLTNNDIELLINYESLSSGLFPTSP